MTLEEVAKKFGVSETSLMGAFPRTQKSILKKWGVHLIKKGRGNSATYEIVEENTDSRALTLYDEIKEDIVFDSETVRLMNWHFLVFFTIIATPMLVFRGSYEDFLNYIQAKVTKENIQELQKTLQELYEKEYISYTIDKTDNNYFIASIYRKREEQMHIGIGMIKLCKQIADAAHKRSWVPLLKTWIGMQMMTEKELFKRADLTEVTGLSYYQINESRKLLEANDIFRTSQVYLDYQTCVGSIVELNGFFNKN